MTKLKNRIREAVSSILSTTHTVFLLSITITPMLVGTMLSFVCSVVMLIISMGLFSLDADMSMMPIGRGIGIIPSVSKERCLMVCITFVIGFIITITESDLAVFAYQIPSASDNTLIWIAVVGIGFFLIMALLRVPFHWNLEYLPILFYVLVLILAYSSMNILMAVAFNSGGVTTGPIMVPFPMALGIDMANVTRKHAEEESSGIVALCSIGPILAVLLSDILYGPRSVTYIPFKMVCVETSRDIIRISLTELPHYMREVGKALLPILRLFLLFQPISSYFNRRTIVKILVGALYTFLGLILFLCGANIGFIPAGYPIGAQIAALSYNWVLIPVGTLIGFFIVKTGPAMHVLTRQMGDISSGTISTKAMLYLLSVGVSISPGITTLRILSCISIMVFLTPGYLAAIILSSFVPNVSTDIAFDPGGVASGPMTATFPLLFAMGVCGQLGGNVLLDTFGIIAMVAMTPLLTTRILGLVIIKHRRTTAGELWEDSVMESEGVINEWAEN